MSNKETLTRMEMTNLFSRHLLLSQGKSALFIEAIIQQIFYALHTREHLKISSFGTFLVHKKKERQGRNPRTGDAAVISARRSVSFRTSNLLKDRINAQESDEKKSPT